MAAALSFVRAALGRPGSFAMVAVAAVAETARGSVVFLVLAGCPITPSCQPG